MTLQNAPCFLDNTGEGKWHEIAQFQTVKVPPKKEKADILTSVCVKEALGKFSLIVSSVSIGAALRNDAQRQDRGIVHEIIVLNMLQCNMAIIR